MQVFPHVSRGFERWWRGVWVLGEGGGDNSLQSTSGGILTGNVSAVIHRGGMVVRNGTAPDLETLLDAMAAEPLED